ncbi:Ornithine aminotransferase, mitochondrial [Tetrabaena socialis]|uniref:Ornithine aminotransferase n=1 Tax=Tetrabaena socialis TaxID=47790 RepID=A0A2J8A118_9CHLO|nr:Ornithine aminotransferase, mitochondrial [Tetrabaena socialis]|eukprot:PNH06217.1 Ornithine aminotransferase, mitochondrial [Tetrabaena socialis]
MLSQYASTLVAGSRALCQGAAALTSQAAARRFASSHPAHEAHEDSYLSSQQQQVIEREDRFGAHNYAPIPVVLNRGEGVFLWDVDGKRYYDFLSAYSAVNQGHCHPKVLVDEGLAANSERLGVQLRQRLAAIPSPLVKSVRGKGLLDALLIDESHGVSAHDVCIRLRDNGLLAKPTQKNIIRFAPPLVMTAEQLHECCDIIQHTIVSFGR